MNRISALLLAAGFAAAVAIWFLAPPAEGDAVRDDPLNEKRYRRELRVIGGQANQLSADFLEWFGERWEGRNLAYTVAVLTLITTAGFRFVAVRWSRLNEGGRRFPYRRQAASMCPVVHCCEPGTSRAACAAAGKSTPTPGLTRGRGCLPFEHPVTL
jgi:hypothetical protein